VFRILKKIFLYLFISQFLYIILLKWMDPPITLTQLGSVLTGDGFKRDYINYDEMSPNIKLAVMASEDQVFPDHNGFDFKSIKKAMAYNEKKPGRIRGASTISQQVAKNVFLWQGRSWIRKGFEVYFTFMIEKFWGKKRILEMYLNVSEMGKGIYGVEAASRVYFNKPAKNLSRYEAALIASALPNPVKYTVKPLSKYVSVRAGWVLRQMGNLDGDQDIRVVINN
jgi:monofunctional biosynthetic peptidoglycan transglycosylase